MLVLGRTINEFIIIESSDGPIKVLVVQLRRGSCRLGIDAPDNCSIHRSKAAELPTRIELEVSP